MKNFIRRHDKKEEGLFNPLFMHQFNHFRFQFQHFSLTNALLLMSRLFLIKLSQNKDLKSANLSIQWFYKVITIAAPLIAAANNLQIFHGPCGVYLRGACIRKILF